MSAQAKPINPSDITDEQVDRIALAVIGRMNQFVVVDKILTTEEAAEYCRYKRARFDDMVKAGKITVRRFDENSDPRFLPSELIEDLKRC